jgi:light-regulated signal transduction histidine kinase (bacteriophytochrome)
VIVDDRQKMSQLINDLLAFSRLGRIKLEYLKMGMRNLAENVYAELVRDNSDRNIEFKLATMPPCLGDSALIRQVFFVFSLMI